IHRPQAAWPAAPPLHDALPTLRRAGHACHVVSSAQDAIESVRRRPPDVVVTDYRLSGTSGTNGLDVLREVKQASPDTEVILVTRSEEHTSELQSREHLVCRLLL